MSELRPNKRQTEAQTNNSVKVPGFVAKFAQNNQARTIQTAAQTSLAPVTTIHPSLTALAQLLGRNHAKAALRKGGRDE